MLPKLQWLASVRDLLQFEPLNLNNLFIHRFTIICVYKITKKKHFNSQKKNDELRINDELP